jgi:two-component system LytT family sensor kinase
MKRSAVFIVLMHLLYWAFPIWRIYIYYDAGVGHKYQDAAYKDSYFNYSFSVLLGMAVFYTFYLFIFPYFIQKRKAITDWVNLGLFIVLMAFGVGLPILVNYLNMYDHGRYHVDMRNVYLSQLNYIISALIIRGFTTWALEINYKKQLEKSNLESNLALLKARINPHFLFNTLNNIDVLIEKDPTIASTYLKKLSDILRFTLYESPSDTIPLSKEADYIKQYIELQQIRTSNADFAKFDFEPGDNDVQVSPMLFIPFIENAFKYSTNKKIRNAVTISLGTNNNEVVFTCSNAYDADSKVQYEENSGLGLELIKSRLELLYPQNYQLAIDKTTDRFNVNLAITLHDDKLPHH